MAEKHEELMGGQGNGRGEGEEVMTDGREDEELMGGQGAGRGDGEKV